jgi:hypothetical protein
VQGHRRVALSRRLAAIHMGGFAAAGVRRIPKASSQLAAAAVAKSLDMCARPSATLPGRKQPSAGRESRHWQDVHGTSDHRSLASRGQGGRHH